MSIDYADEVSLLSTRQWVWGMFSKMVGEWLQRGKHDPCVRPVAVGCDAFVPIERFFQFLEN
ncbi:hypothetical protein M4D81_34490 [Paenibacillus sp. p3-SID867]|uniref:hypothetical protein n=1 Tax=Paenibacillus sp. p3-SID867 TaxID=2916363 RepID=UPI0021A7BBBD|nr:hypothetical protein [Paenibacillus sp. p3-SID867]MCT1404113.1 hypothetical protein [Paenibacillus sp. p3-SID867]